MIITCFLTNTRESWPSRKVASPKATWSPCDFTLLLRDRQVAVYPVNVSGANILRGLVNKSRIIISVISVISVYTYNNNYQINGQYLFKTQNLKPNTQHQHPRSKTQIPDLKSETKKDGPLARLTFFPWFSLKDFLGRWLARFTLLSSKSGSLLAQVINILFGFRRQTMIPA